MLKNKVPQTYDNYYQKYFKSESGRKAKQRAQNKYRAKLREIKRKDRNEFIRGS